MCNHYHTVDGRIPENQLMIGGKHPIIYRFSIYYPRWCRISSIHSINGMFSILIWMS
jgi:hypothetical protein